jgi:hypothetical protein
LGLVGVNWSLSQLIGRKAAWFLRLVVIMAPKAVCRGQKFELEAAKKPLKRLFSDPKP